MLSYLERQVTLSCEIASYRIQGLFLLKRTLARFLIFVSLVGPSSAGEHASGMYLNHSMLRYMAHAAHVR